MLAHGADLGAQVGYRLGGITPDKSASVAAQEAQVDYRLGEESVDSRQVWFLGSGVTAEHLAYRPGERVTPSDGRIVRQAMFGIDRRTGERIRVRTERNRQARIAASPYLSVIQEACSRAGVTPADLWPKRDLSSQFRALFRAGQRAQGTVVVRSAEGPMSTRGSSFTPGPSKVVKCKHLSLGSTAQRSCADLERTIAH